MGGSLAAESLVEDWEADLGGLLIPGTPVRVGVRPERLAPLAAKSIQSFFKNPFFKLFMQFWTLSAFAVGKLGKDGLAWTEGIHM